MFFGSLAALLNKLGLALVISGGSGYVPTCVTLLKGIRPSQDIQEAKESSASKVCYQRRLELSFLFGASLLSYNYHLPLVAK